MHAQTYPSKAIRFVNNFPPGGPSDFLARTVGEAITTAFKQPVVTENKAGAGGNIGADLVAKSPADGYTVLFGIDTAFTVNPYIYKGMPFKPSDFKPIMVMVSSGLLVGANPGTGFKSMKDLIAQGKGKGLNFSSGGSGSPGHLAAEIFMDAAGIQIQHVPYKGNTPAVLAVLSGEVDAGVLATPGMLPHVKAGKITPLAVTSRQRSRSAPEVPTVSELGLKDLELEVLYVAMVPAATPEVPLEAASDAPAAIPIAYLAANATTVAPTTSRAEAIDVLLAQWAVEFLHDSPVSRATDAMNHFTTTALPALRQRLLSEV